MDKANDAASGEGVAYRLHSVDLHFNPETGVTTHAPVVEPISKQILRHSPIITAKERIVLEILAEAGDRGLPLKELNKYAREKGLGETRPADLVEIRNALVRKKMIEEDNGSFRLSTAASTGAVGDTA
jgi:hypothetical protein